MNNHELDEWKAFLNPVLAPYELDPCISIYLIGRAAKCDFSERMELHDIDLLIIGEHFGEPCIREVVVKEEIAYDISYVKASSLRDMITAKHPMWIEMLAHSKLLQSSGGVGIDLVEKAVHLWQQGPGRPDQSNIKRIRFECGQLFENLNRSKSEPIQFEYLMAYSLHRVVILYFELEGRWLPKPKKQMATLKQLNGEIYDLLALSLTDLNTYEKIAHFEEVLEKMLSDYGGLMLDFSKGTYPIDL